MNTLLRQNRNTAHQGQTLVLFALLSLLLLAGLGLIFDAGLEYRNRRTMQNAADVAALRGARVIAQKKASNLANNFILQEVQNAAVANGVPSASNVICSYLNDSRTILTACDDTTIPSTATGVRVEVSETHTPLVMRVLGITTTGTAARAAAQVQMVRAINALDVPFMVCGVDTAKVGGGTFDILQVDLQTDPEPSTGSGPYTTSYETVHTPITINSGAYSYDWNVRLNGDFELVAGAPQFIIYGNNIEDCGAANWKGLVSRSDVSLRLATTNSIPAIITFQSGSIGNVGDASPERSVNGTQGCRASDGVNYPDACIMLLPIVHNQYSICPSQCSGITTNAERKLNTTTLRARRWGVFKIERSGSEYYGRLIKNYPLHTDGVIGWDPTIYAGPINVTLVQTP